MFETNKSSLLASTGTATISGNSISSNLYMGTGTTINSDLHVNGTLTYLNSNKMTIRQAKVAVFTVERNEENEVISTKFVKELWVQVKNGASLDLVVAKELKGDFDPETTVIKEIQSFSF